MRTPTSATLKRRKRVGPEVRDDALAIARQLLLTSGPRAVTLANIGDALGMTHANILYHFGSAADLQLALMTSMINYLTAALDRLAGAVSAGTIAPLSVADRIFDAFDKGGGGTVTAWIILWGSVEQLAPIRTAIGSLVEAIARQTGDAAAGGRIRKLVLMGVVAAFGDAVIGPHIRDMLDQSDDATRDLMARIAPQLLMASTVAAAPLQSATFGRPHLDHSDNRAEKRLALSVDG